MGKKILLADDSITIQKVIELTFSDEDFEVVTVGNGRLAIEKVSDVRPDLVLCDIIMPEKDGYEVCDFIKKNPATSHIPVLLLTGAFEPFDQERAARVGCDGFLAKPFEPQTLISKVKDLLSQAAARPRAAAPAPAPTFAPAAAAAPTAPPMAAPAPAAAPPPAPMAAPAPPPMAAPVAPPVAAPTPMPTFSAPPAPAGPPPAAERLDTVEALPFEAPSTASEREVSFIDEEPYGEAFAGGPAAYEEAPPTAYEAAASEPVEELYTPMEPMEEYGAPSDELMGVSDEESATLQAEPPPAPMLVDEPAPWAQPTVEVPLEDRAQAGVGSAEGTFEEVFEEDLSGAVATPSNAPAPAAPFAAAPSPLPEPYPPIPAAPLAARVPEAAAVPETPAPAPPAAPPPAPEPPPAPSPTFEDVAPAPAARAYEPPPPGPMRSFEPPYVPPAATPEPEKRAPEPVEIPEPEPSFAEVAPPAPAPPALAASVAAEVGVPVDMVEKIAQRVVAQISEKVIREIAWDVIPDLAESLIKKEIERLKAELQQT